MFNNTVIFHLSFYPQVQVFYVKSDSQYQDQTICKDGRRSTSKKKKQPILSEILDGSEKGKQTSFFL